MRKIKFRAKMTGFQSNVFGTPGNVYQDKDSNNEWFDSIFFQDGNGNKCQEYIDCHTLSQFTGLTDKNSVEIYENDIIKKKNFNGEEYEATYIVVYSSDSFCLKMISGNDKSMHSVGLSSFSCRENKTKLDKEEVIGNIFDNPELL